MSAATTSSGPVEGVLAAADSAGRKRRADGRGGWLISCPGPLHRHGDRNPSLGLSLGADGRALLHCYAGCDSADVLHSLNLTERDLFADTGRAPVVPIRRARTIAEHTGNPHREPSREGSREGESIPCDLDACARVRRSQDDLGECIAQYAYRDASGKVVGQVHRYNPKTFRPYTLDARGAWKAGGKIAVPYRLPEALDVLASGGLLVIVEGEKDADALAELGVAATCNAGGAGKWTEAHTDALADAVREGGGSVCIVGDTDAAGQAHARKVRDMLAAVGVVAAVQWPTRGKDIAEHLANGGTFDELRDDLATAEQRVPSSWEPLDLGQYLDGTHTPEVAGLFPRTDGSCLLYAGRLHSFHGESESGKSLVAQAEAARLLAAGERVLFIDFESDAATVVPRLLAMGAPATAIRDRLRYVRPQEPPTDTDGRQALSGLLADRYALAVIDGLTDALGMFGSSSLDLDEVSKFMRAFPRRVAIATGAATVVIDHVTKASDTRGRFAVGSQAKMNALDGAAYVVEVDHPLGLGLRGVVSLRIAKDRPGTVRPTCGTYRKTDRTQHAARVVFDATGDDGRTVVTVEPPSARVGDDSDTRTFRPTWVMQRVSEWLEGRHEPSTFRGLKDGIGGKEEILRAAISTLTTEGYVTTSPGPRNATLHTSARPYRELLDPRSDKYEQPGA